MTARRSRWWPFQLTAARRRLARVLPGALQIIRFNSQPPEGGWFHQLAFANHNLSFNSQPPEGGWLTRKHRCRCLRRFQLTAARRRLEVDLRHDYPFHLGFNSQPPEGGWRQNSAFADS